MLGWLVPAGSYSRTSPPGATPGTSADRYTAGRDGSCRPGASPAHVSSPGLLPEGRRIDTAGPGPRRQSGSTLDLHGERVKNLMPDPWERTARFGWAGAPGRAVRGGGRIDGWRSWRMVGRRMQRTSIGRQGWGWGKRGRGAGWASGGTEHEPWPFTAAAACRLVSRASSRAHVIAPGATPGT